MEEKGIIFYLLTDKEITIKRKPRIEILIERKQENKLQIQLKDGSTFENKTVKKYKPEEYKKLKLFRNIKENKKK
jgi:hypothetical protein